MKKNYYNKDLYDALGVGPSAPKSAIDAAYKSISPATMTPLQKLAFDVLTDDAKRKDYDTKHEAYIKRNEWYKKNKVKIWGSIAALGGVAVVTACIFQSCAKGNGEGDLTPTPQPTKKPTATPTPGVTVTPSITVRPTITPVPTVAPTATVTPTATPTPTPIVPENVSVLNSFSTPVMAEYFVEKVAEKGLVVEAADLQNALLIVNNEIIAREEMAIMVPSMDLMTAQSEDELSVKDSCEYYMNAVATHNIKNAVYGKDITKYVSVSDLAFGTTDDVVVSALDEFCAWFIKSINEGTFTKEEFKEAYYTMSKFCERKSSISIDGVEYRYDDLSSGAKCALERCLWPVFSTTCMLSEHLDKEVLEDLQGVTTNDMDGANYVNELYHYTTATPTPTPVSEEEKTR